MKTLRSNRGIAIIYVTLFLLVLGIVFFALGVDVGWMAYVKTQGQKATDASALAAAAAIPNANTSNTPDKVNELAQKFNSDNVVMNISADIQPPNVELCNGDVTTPTCGVAPSVAAGVRVTKTYNVPLFFTRLLNGAGSTNLSVSSTAWVGGASSACKAGQEYPCIPLAVRECKVPRNPDGSLNCGGIPVALQSPDSSADNSAFTTFLQTGNNVCKDMASGDTAIPEVSTGQTINLVGSGQATSCEQELQDRFNDEKTTEGCPTGYSPCWIVTVPIIECDGNMSDGDIVGFATFAITNIIIDGNNKEIWGSLSCSTTIPGSLGGGNNFGTYADRPVLVK